MAETVARIRRDLAAKGIVFFAEIDQAKLAAEVGIALRPSTLLLFGNPPLGVQFLASNPDSGLDWPVRLLVRQDEAGTVWAVHTDFAWIARRYGITDRDAHPAHQPPAYRGGRPGAGHRALPQRAARSRPHQPGAAGAAGGRASTSSTPATWRTGSRRRWRSSRSPGTSC